MSLPYIGEFRVTKLYGSAPPAGVHYATGKHSGIDLVGVNKEIRAIGSGTVYKVGNDTDGWGKYIVVKQVDGYYVIYCHCSKIFKTAGQCVRSGDWIATEGATGQVTGGHLHLEMRKIYSNNLSTINPIEYLGIENRTGWAKVVSELLKDVTINLNGKEKIVKAIEKDGFNYIKLQDLRDDKIEIGYANGKPSIKAK